MNWNLNPFIGAVQEVSQEQFLGYVVAFFQAVFAFIVGYFLFIVLAFLAVAGLMIFFIMRARKRHRAIVDEITGGMGGVFDGKGPLGRGRLPFDRL